MLPCFNTLIWHSWINQMFIEDMKEEIEKMEQKLLEKEALKLATK